MEMVPRVLIGVGVLLVLFGVLFWAAQAAGLDRLPGDVVIDRPHVKLAFPIVTSLIVSVVLTVALNIALRLWR